jgi:hypothetical protein
MTTFLLSIVLSFALLGQGASDFDYGKPTELRGLTKIFVYTDLDTKSRDAIIKEIQKQVRTLEVVERREDAQVWLIYTQTTRRDFRGIVGNSEPTSTGGATGTARPIYRNTPIGAGYVVIPGIEGKRDRLLLSFRDEKTNAFERKPTVNFAREFVKAYKEASK